MESNLEDAELLRRYAGDRDEDAFAELVRRHLGFVYHAALRQCGGDAHRAEDVAQTVFTDLARKAAKLARRPVLAGWLYTSTRYAAAQAVRSEARRQAREQEAHAMNEILSDNNAESAAEWERLRPVIDDALHALDERDREAVLLRFFEGRGFADVGAKLFLTEDAARMRVERALDKLRAALVRRGITSTTAALGVALANQAAATVPAGIAASVTGAALVGATLGGPITALTFLNFMSTTKSIAGIASLIAVVAIGSAVYETNEVRTTRSLLATLSRDHGDLIARLKRAEDKVAQSATDRHESEAQITLLRTEISRLRRGNGGTAAARGGEVASANVVAGAAFASLQDRLVGDPDYLQLKAKLDRANVRLKYGPLFQKLHLSLQQVEAFENRWVVYNQTASDVAAAVSAQGVSLSDPNFGVLVQKSMQESARSLGADLQNILGLDGAKEFGAYGATAAVRELVGSLASNVYYSEAPLTAEQGEQLAKIFASNSASLQAGGYAKTNHAYPVVTLGPGADHVRRAL